MNKNLINTTANLNHQQTHTKISKLINSQENKIKQWDITSYLLNWQTFKRPIKICEKIALAYFWKAI